MKSDCPHSSREQSDSIVALTQWLAHTLWLLPLAEGLLLRIHTQVCGAQCNVAGWDSCWFGNPRPSFISLFCLPPRLLWRKWSPSYSSFCLPPPSSSLGFLFPVPSVGSMDCWGSFRNRMSRLPYRPTSSFLSFMWVYLRSRLCRPSSPRDPQDILVWGLANSRIFLEWGMLSWKFPHKRALFCPVLKL